MKSSKINFNSKSKLSRISENVNIPSEPETLNIINHELKVLPTSFRLRSIDIERFEDVKLGHTYVVVTKDDGLSYKRIMHYHKKEAALELHSDNKIYQPYKVKLSEILELWEYTCCINMNQYDDKELNLDSIMNMLRGLKVEIAGIKKR